MVKLGFFFKYFETHNLWSKLKFLALKFNFLILFRIKYHKMSCNFRWKIQIIHKNNLCQNWMLMIFLRWILLALLAKIGYFCLVCSVIVAAVDRGFLQNMHIAVVIMFCRAHAHCSSHTTSAQPICTECFNCFIIKHIFSVLNNRLIYLSAKYFHVE